MSLWGRLRVAFKAACHHSGFWLLDSQAPFRAFFHPASFFQEDSINSRKKINNNRYPQEFSDRVRAKDYTG